MKTVEVVIRIDKNTFDAVNGLSKFVDDNHIINGYQMKGHSTVGSMITAIANGTVLPKGHGRLKDYDAIKSEYIRKMSVFMSEEERMDLLCTIVDEAEAVIEADKESDNEC